MPAPLDAATYAPAGHLIGNTRIGHDEEDRIRAVQRYEVVDAQLDETFDRITALTARVLQAPVTLIGIVEAARVCLISRYGLDRRELPRVDANSPSLFLHPGPWIVPDTGSDRRTRLHPLVNGEPGLSFYAGAPLITNDGYNLGALCVLDSQPRDLSPADLAILQDLAALVMHQLELRLEVRCALKMDDALLQRSRSENRRAEYLSKHDALTGLGNRRKLDEIFAVEINRLRRHGGNLCLSIADLDHFKRVNDNHGHAIGDEVLAQFGELLCQQMRPTDTAARIGGEEFVVLMPHTNIREALGTAERLRSAIIDKKLGPQNDTVTISIGVAEWREGEDGEALLQRADRALYSAKHAGRNRVASADAVVDRRDHKQSKGP